MSLIIDQSSSASAGEKEDQKAIKTTTSTTTIASRRLSSLSLSISSLECKDRPFIASPFMPIATQLSVDPDRRSIGNAQSRDANRNGTTRGYGSTRRVEEGQLLKKAEEEEEESSEEDESEGDDGSSSGESLTEQKTSLRHLNKKQWATIVMLTVANFCSTVAFSCIAPYYPVEATSRGLTESQTGIVFGVFELTMFIMSPIAGKWMARVGSRNMFISGLAITGVTAILFGTLTYLPSGTSFYYGSVLVRILEAFGDAAFVTSSFTIAAKGFPGKVVVIIGIFETAAGFGCMAGPPIGGFLYEMGGFLTPMLVLGSILLFSTALSFCLIDKTDDEEGESDSRGMLGMLRIPVIWIMLYAVIACAISFSFLDPTLSGHLQTFNLSPMWVGMLFLLCGGVYTLSAPIWGIIMDRFRCPVTILLFGTIATILAMAIIGPSPILPLEKSLFLICVALVLLGVAAGALYVPSFQNCLDAVKANGYDDSFATYGCVSGVFQSAWAFGAFVGPTAGGVITEHIGFAWTTTIIGILHLLFTITVIFYFGRRRLGRKSLVLDVEAKTEHGVPTEDT